MKYHPIYSCLASAIDKTAIPRDKICVVSDFLADPDISDFLGVDTFHVHRGRAIPFGTGLKLGNPELKIVTLFGDLLTIGGNHFMHNSRRNMDLVVLCVNNFIYPEIAGTKIPRLQIPFSQYATFEKPPNVPHVAKSCGAVYVSRWTAKHIEELSASMQEALETSGFSTIEILAPGSCYFPGTPKIDSAINLLDLYFQNSKIDHSENTANLEIKPDTKIIVGNFFHTEKTTFIDSYNQRLSDVLGNKFKPYR
jgi:2-oxoglutarate ferredoxin oxidoreductase subunit beta